MSTTSHPQRTPLAPERTRREFARRLDDIGWGVFALMTGVLWLLSYTVPSGTWLVCTGLLLLALNAVRYFSGLELNLLTVVLGVLALTGGLADLADVRLPILAIALVAFGVLLLIKPFAKRGG
ncbi:MAG TPA: hypothetical protein VF041_05235 [Gemmatimonadaceae bacterium]